ncbi:hypothetical protein NDU88_006684 [Pleurodeles waltl]|uniref:Uncharacterized protein n=1 Tax=Pleurodeles waltl TaxID=8319 RepID=A0AAV7LSM6_PLEWA|nr:hypothetical protein NDU88_006684 [Pleurodeles waltl]
MAQPSGGLASRVVRPDRAAFNQRDARRTSAAPLPVFGAPDTLPGHPFRPESPRRAGWAPSLAGPYLERAGTRTGR